MNLKVVMPTLSIMSVLLLSTATLTTLAPSSASAAKIDGSGTCSLSKKKIQAFSHKWISTKNQFEARALYSRLKKKIVNPGSGTTNNKFRHRANHKYGKNKFTCVTFNKVRSGKNGRGSKLDTFEVITYYRLSCKSIEDIHFSESNTIRRACLWENSKGRLVFGL